MIQKLTVRWLKEHQACKYKTKEFTKLFPDGMEFNLENLEKLRTGIYGFWSLDLIWLAEEMFNGKQCTDFRGNYAVFEKPYVWFARNFLRVYLEVNKKSKKET